MKPFLNISLQATDLLFVWFAIHWKSPQAPQKQRDLQFDTQSIM